MTLEPNYIEDAEKALNDTKETGDTLISTETERHIAAAPARNVRGPIWAIVCLSIYVSCGMYGLDMTIAADVQATIIVQFDSVDRLAWVGSGFLLGSVCTIFPVAVFYTAFNLKYVFIGSVLLFEIGSAICGAAPTMDALIIGRVIAGVGGSGIYLGTLNYLTALTSEHERGKYMSGIGLVWGVGAILGPVIGGAFSQSSATWRWAFYINLVVAAACAPIYIFYLPSIEPSGSARAGAKKTITSFDWMGWTLSTSALVSISLALTNGGNIWPWNDYRTLLVWAFFGILIAATVIQQKIHGFTTAETRLFSPQRILQNRTLILLNIQTAVTIANIFVPLYFIPLYFQFVKGDSAIKAAVRLLPFILVFVTTTLLSGTLLPKINYYLFLYAISAIFMTVGGGLMYTVQIKTNPAKVYGYSVLLAIGSGLSSQAGYAIAGIKLASKGWPAGDIQRSITLQNFWQIVSSLLALLVSGQIFQSLAAQNMSRALSGHGFSDTEIREAVAGLQSSLLESLNPDLTRKAVGAITEAIRPVYILNIVYGGICLLSAFLMKKEPLFPKQPYPGL
ncbi:putative efflux pump antibiotic resistance protein [Xylogone sp. PMI_703]|nr:putative efflux pump antibiotic resistance protein [Xylogone sp. PMI_703]